MFYLIQIAAWPTRNHTNYNCWITKICLISGTSVRPMKMFVSGYMCNPNIRTLEPCICWKVKESLIFLSLFSQGRVLSCGMDDAQEQDQYEERLKEVFNSFDASGCGSLCPEELSDLCLSLHLDDATPALLQTLLQKQDRLTARVRLFLPLRCARASWPFGFPAWRILWIWPGACVEPLQLSGLCVSGLAGALLAVLLRRKCGPPITTIVIPGVCRQDNRAS